MLEPLPVMRLRMFRAAVRILLNMRTPPIGIMKGALTDALRIVLYAQWRYEIEAIHLEPSRYRSPYPHSAHSVRKESRSSESRNDTQTQKPLSSES